MADDRSLQNKRRLLTGCIATGGLVAAGATTKVFFDGMKPTQVVREAHHRTADVSRLSPGEFLQIEFRGQPVIIYRRTSDQIKDLEKTNEDLLDPGSDAKQQPDYAKNKFRSLKPEFFVAHPVCTHLGCAVNFKPHGTEDPKDENKYFLQTTDWKGGFSCPCHGALFDLAGHVYKNMAAPLNLAIPEHRYTNDSEIEFVVNE